MKKIFFVLIYLIFAQWLLAQDLAKTPPMGWNSWNYFGYDINDSLIRGTIDAMVSSGMRNETNGDVVGHKKYFLRCAKTSGYLSLISLNLQDPLLILLYP